MQTRQEDQAVISTAYARHTGIAFHSRTLPGGVPKSASRALLAAAALVIAFVAATQPTTAAVQQFNDGRYVKTNGNFCASYLPGAERVLRVPVPTVMGFRNGPNKVQITPHVQYSFNLQTPTWSNWFKLGTATYSSNNSYLTPAEAWRMQMPDDSRSYVVRTVYEIRWAIYNTSNQIIGWTDSYWIAEDLSQTQIWVGNTLTAGFDGCLIH